nr:hypothetical protein [Photorhabdus tasmaniensis]
MYLPSAPGPFCLVEAGRVQLGDDLWASSSFMWRCSTVMAEPLVKFSMVLLYPFRQ